MVQAIFDIVKDQTLLYRYTLNDLDINKQEVEKSIFDFCGLKGDQYEVFYIDDEDDYIMASGEDDYIILADQIQGDSIMFRISLLVDDREVRFSEKYRETILVDEVLDQSSGVLGDLSEGQSEKETNERWRDIQKLQNIRGNQVQDVSNKQERIDASIPDQKTALIEKDQKKLETAEETGLNVQSQQNRPLLIEVQDIPELKLGNQAVKKESEIDIVFDLKDIEKEDQHKDIDEGEQRKEIEEVDQLMPQNLDTIDENARSAQEREHARQLASQSDRLQSSFTDRSQKLISSMSQKLLEVTEKIEQLNPNSNGEVHIKDGIKEEENQSPPKTTFLDDPEVMEKMFSYFSGRLPEVLRENCFKHFSQSYNTEKVSVSFNCSACQDRIIEIPFYISQTSEKICHLCQPSYDAELLVKVKSHRQANELQTVKMVPINRSDLTDNRLAKDHCQFQQERQINIEPNNVVGSAVKQMI